MKRLISLLLLGSSIGCQTEIKPVRYDDVAGRASGHYVVNLYVINGDTLYSSSGINKINAKEFYIDLGHRKSDSLQMSVRFKEIDAAGSTNYTRFVGVSEKNGVFQLLSPGVTSSDYEGTITNNTFTERTKIGVGGGFLINPPIPFPTTTDPALEGILIVAEKFLKE